MFYNMFFFHALPLKPNQFQCAGRVFASQGRCGGCRWEGASFVLAQHWMFRERVGTVSLSLSLSLNHYGVKERKAHTHSRSQQEDA